MNKNEQRIRRLEDAIAASDSGLVCIHVPNGERFEDCIRRAGYDPANWRMTFVPMDDGDLRA
jgi:hypothetical protein